MGAIANPRQIVNRRELAAALDALAAAEANPERLRSGVLAAFKAALERGRAEVRRRFESELSGTAAVRSQSFLMDQLIRTLHEFVTVRIFPLANPTAGERVAVGGYGRGELAPFSDIDLLFLLPYKTTPSTEQVVEWMLYLLWDLGLKVGHATRSVDECLRQAKADLTIRTALLEARFISGEEPLYRELKTRFAAEIVAESGLAFVADKLA